MNLYDIALPSLKRSLSSLSAVLKKGEDSAQARGIDPAVLLNARLAPDMFPLTRQVQIACDMARRGAARLAAVEITEVADDETSFAELQDRISAALAYLDTFTPEQFEGAESRIITLPVGASELKLDGLTFLTAFVFGNLGFHTTTAYNILRHNGVELGKRDYLGNP